MPNADVNTNGVLTNSGLTKAGYFIILAGQSNGTDYFTMSGNIPAGIQGTNIDFYTWYKNNAQSWNSTAGNWVQMQPGVNTNLGAQSAGKFGLGLIIANRLLNTYGKAAYVVPTCVSNTYLADDVANSWNTLETPLNSWYYNSLVNCVRPAWSAVNISDMTKVLIWIQGENDSDNATRGSNYGTNLVTLLNAYKTAFDPNMKIILVKLRSDYNGGPGSNPGLNGVRDGYDHAQSNLTNCETFDANTANTPLAPDNIHYNPQSASFVGTMSIVNMGDDLADLISAY